MTNLLIKWFVKNADATENPDVRLAYGRMAGVVGIVCNLLLAASKLAVGLFSGSISIAADAVNNLSDTASSVITLAGFRMASKPADKEHPFGHARFEYIAGLSVAILIMVIGIELAKSSFARILSPAPVRYNAVALAVLGLSILVKLWMALFNRSIGRRIHSPALIATFADSRNDVVATAAVLAAAAVAWATGLSLDGWMGLAVAAFVLVSGALLVRDTLNPLLGEAPDPELVKYVGDKIKSYSGVLGTHDLIVHDYGPGRRFASAHVEMSSEQDVMHSHDTIDNIEQDFLQNDNIHLIIHYDPVETGDEEVNTARGFAARAVAAIDSRMTIHDFRMVDGPTHTNYIFDVVAPVEMELDEDALREQIEAALQHGTKKINAVVTVDRSYAPIPN